MKRPQFITIGVAIFLIAVIYFFGRTTPIHRTSISTTGKDAAKSPDLTDSLLNSAKKAIKPDQLLRITTLENSISRGDVKDQKLRIYHQLAHFWKDSARLFLPFAHYEAESARLENSENSLTFAARLFLDKLQEEQDVDVRRWEALQAKDLFERSLIINPRNDSSVVGLGACYMFGNISAAPMEGIAKIRSVLNRDSTNVYAHMMLVNGLLLSGQYPKAIEHLETVNRLQPNNLEAALILADTYERTGDKAHALTWYQRTYKLAPDKQMKTELQSRIEQLKK